MRSETADGWRGRARQWHARLFLSVRGRATTITVAVSALILLLALTLGMLLARDWAENNVEETAERTVERVAFDLVSGQPAKALDPRPGESPIVQIVSRDGRRVLAASEEVIGRPPLAPTDLTSGELLIDRKSCPSVLDECVWIFGMRLRTSAYGDGVMVTAASPLPTLASAWLLPVAMAVILVALLSLIAWWTWHTVGRALAPVDGIRSELAHLSARALDQRVTNPRTGGEIQDLAETVNETLDRLEEATNRERRFISDASHDLRNPIAGLHTRLEVALEEPGDENWRTAVRAALHDVERLNEIVIDLLEQSRLDSRVPQPVERVDLAELARRELERRPEGVPITTRLEPGVIVRANPVRLSRLLGNLLSNAERHAASAIEVIVTRECGEAVVVVADDGDGIPKESRERVFERFARLPDSRRRDPEGTGLGLPIAREIARIYGGSLSIADSCEGARFVVRLPLASADAS
ncbi:sensor histidine kinase [Actinomadura macra]|uniref:sensor histidine kinase n=1 Tax=Actinomadura macra TaxID=46164 RepID=UPI000A0567E8|nr:HAMP domain-containing sensor histidine kinase [Actinomadura macra]